MDDDGITRKTKDPKGMLSLLAPLVIVIVYTIMDGLHRFIFVQRQSQLQYDVSALAPLASQCEDVQVQSLTNDQVSRKVFSGYAEDLLLYARDMKVLLLQVIQDVFGTWSYASIPALHANVYTENLDVLSEKDWMQWRYYLFGVVVVFLILCVVFVLMASLWSDFQDGLELTHSPVQAFNYAYSKLSKTAKTLLTGFYIVCTVILLKVYARIAYHGMVIGLVLILMTVILCILLIYSVPMLFGYKKEELNQVANNVIQLVSDADASIKNDKNTNNLASIGSRIVKYIEETGHPDLSKGLREIKQKALQSFEEAIEGLGIKCSFNTVPKLAFENKVRSVIEKKLKEKELTELLDSRDDPLGKLLQQLNITTTKKQSLIGHTWLVCTDYIASVLNKTDELGNSAKGSCDHIASTRPYRFSSSPFLTVLKFLLFEKLGTQFILCIIISILVVNGSYELTTFLKLPESVEEWFINENDDEKTPSHPVRSIFVASLVVSVCVIGLYIAYILLLVAIRNVASSRLTNWMLKQIRDAPEITIEHYILKELVLHDHVNMDNVVSMPECDWLYPTCKIAKRALFVIIVAILVGTLVTLTYAHVHFTSLKKSEEEKRKLGTNHFITFHKSIVITVSVLALFGSLITFLS